MKFPESESTFSKKTWDFLRNAICEKMPYEVTITTFKVEESKISSGMSKWITYETKTKTS